MAAPKGIADPALRLLNLACSCLINEPKYYQDADSRKQQIIQCAALVAQTEPEFLLKLALYVRDDLNIRGTANFLAALACNTPGCHALLGKYFPTLLRLPTDMLEMVDFYFALPDSVRRLASRSLPAAVRRAIQARFAAFDEYALGKYNRERSARQKAAKRAKANNVPLARVAFKEGARGAAAERRKTTLKQLIRAVHIAAPAQNVMAILGRKYAATEAEFAKSGLPGAFDPARAGKRMRLPTPETWETALSAMGNKAETWEALLDRKKLPFMAMLRNLRNLLLTGVSEAHHALVLGRLTDGRAVAASRQLPWRFLSAYEAINVDVERLLNDLLDHDAIGCGEKIIQVRVKGRKGARMGQQRIIRKRVIIPKCVPDLPLIARYRAALDTAVRLSVLHNLSPVRGHTVVFVDVSDSMRENRCSTRGDMASLQSALDVAVLLGLMLQAVCESCDFRLFASPSRESGGRPDVPVELREDALLANVKRVIRAADALGGGTDFPVEYVVRLTEARTRVDNFVIISDMMIAPGEEELPTRDRTVSSLFAAYREQVNPDMRLFAIDLYGSGRAGVVACEEGRHANDVLITGFSDHVLRLIAERGKDAQLEYVRTIDKSKRLSEAGAPRAVPAAAAEAVAKGDE